MNEEEHTRSGLARRYLVMVSVTGLLLLALTGVLGGGIPPTRTDTLHVGSGYSYTTIGSAVAAASPNDKIVIHPGTYEESVILNKKVELHGTNMNSTIVNGNGASALIITVDGCRISGLNLTGGIPSGWNGEEVWMAGLELRSDHNEIF